jgi:hypothetical protein
MVTSLPNDPPMGHTPWSSLLDSETLQAAQALLALAIFISTIIMLIIFYGKSKLTYLSYRNYGQQGKMTTDHVNKSTVYSKKFAHLRLPPELFAAIEKGTASSSNKNSKEKIVRQAKKILRFVLPAQTHSFIPDATSMLDLSSWQLDADAIAGGKFLDTNATPLLCFVNCKSGGKQGKLPI